MVTPCSPASVGIATTAPSGTTANLTIDSTNGDPVPAGGLNYAGAGGLIITGSGTVALSGTNTYTGGTSVTAGTLLVSSASGLLAGGSLTVGADAASIFSSSSSDTSGATSTTMAVPSSAIAASTSQVSTLSAISPSAALQPRQSVAANALGTRAADRVVWSAFAKPSPPAALPVAEESEMESGNKLPHSKVALPEGEGSDWDDSDAQHKKVPAILALDAVFAQYGQ
jgi:autotransporter-associated beta strand protein